MARSDWLLGGPEFSYLGPLQHYMLSDGPAISKVITKNTD